MSEEKPGIIPPGRVYDSEKKTVYTWSNERFDGAHRHEIFHADQGGYYRDKCIELGLYIFLEPWAHNESNKGIHFNKRFDKWMKKHAQKIAMKEFNWSVEDFIKEFGRSYL